MAAADAAFGPKTGNVCATGAGPLAANIALVVRKAIWFGAKLARDRRLRCVRVNKRVSGNVEPAIIS